MADLLPIEGALPALLTALRESGTAVLQAPPGAGKTTRVPLAVLEAGLTEEKIVMLEPRRLAARVAAQRMADMLGEPLGQTVGFRIRGESKTSRNTRIEVVTEGILTRMIQSDPGLDGIGVIIFDEFHERSIHADLGLALTLEVRQTLRDDLKLIVMSATLDAEPVSALIGDAPLITSEGRSFPVEPIWLARPRHKEERFESAIVSLVEQAISETDGGILVFLPGEREIRNVADRLANVGPEVSVSPLYGSMPFKDQRDAIAPLKGARKLVLATSIAETSLTIPDIQVVVDGGLARRARFDPGSGMSRLVTERVTRAEATQRMGRAGRVSQGTCYKLWTRGEDGGMSPFPPAEIEAADLTGLALELAEWGNDELPFLTPPPPGALKEARNLLASLGAMRGVSITEHGRAIARLPVHPRLGHMLLECGRDAAELAALLSDRDPLRGVGADLGLRIEAIRKDRVPGAARIRAEAQRLSKLVDKRPGFDLAEAAARAFPDRIALKRTADAPRWLTSGGKGVKLEQTDPLARSRMLVAVDTDGHPKEAQIRQALPIDMETVRRVFRDQIESIDVIEWSKRSGKVVAQSESRLGQLVLHATRLDNPPEEGLARAMMDGVRELGIPSKPESDQLRIRVALMREAGFDLPDMSDEALLADLEGWLLPFIGNTRTATEWRNFDTYSPLKSSLNWDQQQLLDREAPSHFTTPLDRKIAIDYCESDPTISVRLQEMFGVTSHPLVAGRPLRVTLLSPAQRPVQTTMDLPGFWETSYEDVRKDMRGRYPKHPWPDDPTKADPTLRVKRKQ